ncbi:hypothetical protein [Glaciecola sp. SC05]|uniref:hypothetical protein n=1 Tax=Glaciecola sp. SC05 TaxID=1987355 RepID=UPI003527A74E
MTLSKPDTSHSLTLNDSNGLKQKSVFNLRPVNNERLGVFVDINDIEIGYALDVFDNELETKTQNFLVSYRKWKHSRITFNYQTLEGLQIDAENLSGTGFDRQFSQFTKSTKIELFGLHNLYTFGEAESLFEHFFLNRPRLSQNFDWSLSILGGWSLKHLSLENDESIIFQPEYLSQQLTPVTELNSFSASLNIGPFLSVNLPNNFNFFAEYRVGEGYIRNLSGNKGLKQSGDDKQQAAGAGFSWTSSNQKTLVLIRAWQQKGRHIDTSFGDISVVRFF